ncbi:MAG: TolC family protein [Planctomycetaceae bacterium]|nr:MAG: TolC family protein [Planctomycetaceae bacterium]
MNNHILIKTALVGLGAFAFAGCVNPDVIDQKMLTRYQEQMAKTSPQARVDNTAQGKLGLLQPPGAPNSPTLKIVKNAEGKATIPLSLEETIMRTLANSLDIRVTSFDPEINRQEVIKAAAEFDYIMFGGFNWGKQNNAVNSTIGGGRVDTTGYNAGVRQKTITGAEQQIAWTQTRTRDNTSSLVKPFQPAWEDTLVYQVRQPLLRNGWPEFNLAQMHIAQVNLKISNAQFRQKVEETVNEVISTYWLLIQTRRDLYIQDALLRRTQETAARMAMRHDIDATKVQLKQTEAAVESRRAVLIRIKKNIMDTQDKLARLMNDKEMNLISEYEIIPTTPPITELVKLDIADQLLTGLRYNPVLEQARLAIEGAAINVKVAENQALPRIDFIGSAGLQGLDQSASEANTMLRYADHANYTAGIEAEYPIGNRQRLADLSAKRFSYLKSITDMQNTADQLGLLIRERIRQVQTSHDEMLAQRSATDAAQAQLDALEATEKFRGTMDPAFLQVKLQAQETLANAQRAEVQAIMDYNSSMADLSRVTGTTLELQRVRIAMPVVMEEQAWPKKQPKEEPSDYLKGILKSTSMPEASGNSK